MNLGHGPPLPVPGYTAIELRPGLTLDTNLFIYCPQLHGLRKVFGDQLPSRACEQRHGVL